MKERRPRPVRACLLDIEGVLVRDKRYEPVAGAVAWVADLQRRGVPYCLVSNNTTHRPQELVAALAAAGFAVTVDRLAGVLELGARRLREDGRQRLLWLGTPRLAPYWREQGFALCEPGREATADAVVLGVNPELALADLERTLAPLLDGGAHVLCLHRNLFYLDGAGQRRLGPGAWAAALEALVGEERLATVGKPEPAIYLDALDRIGATADETLFISDDPVADLVTAGRLGMTTAFVLSGKHADHAVLGRLPADDWPDIIAASLADLEPPKREEP